jgi:hypothetical protein
MSDTMTPDEIRAARLSLGLTPAQLGAMLECDGQTVQRLEMAAERKTARQPAARMVRLLRLYLAGARPADWPEAIPPAPSAADRAAMTANAAEAAGLVGSADQLRRDPLAAAAAVAADLSAAIAYIGADAETAPRIIAAAIKAGRDCGRGDAWAAKALRCAAAAGATPGGALAAVQAAAAQWAAA